MSDAEHPVKNFLQRWSRRKRAAETQALDATEPPGRERRDADANAPLQVGAQSEAKLPAFNPATLPPIESIVAASDIRAFLAPGVPEELTRAALRRVWVTDPAIRDFIGIAENQWDFTKPDTVPGFGSLELTADVRRMVANLIGDAAGQTTPRRHASAEKEKAGQITQTTGEKAPTAWILPREEDAIVAEGSHARINLIASGEASAESAKVVLQDREDDVAVQKRLEQADRGPRPSDRRHGGALPTSDS